MNRGEQVDQENACRLAGRSKVDESWLVRPATTAKNELLGDAKLTGIVVVSCCCCWYGWL